MMDGREGKSGTHESRNRIYTPSSADISHSEYLSRHLYNFWWSDCDTGVCLEEEGIDEVGFIQVLDIHRNSNLVC